MRTNKIDGYTFPLFDTRDNGEDRHLQCKTYQEIHCALYGRNGWGSSEAMERATTGFTVTDETYPTYLRKLLREARKRGEIVLAAGVHNYGVSIIVKAYDAVKARRQSNRIGTANE